MPGAPLRECVFCAWVCFFRGPSMGQPTAQPPWQLLQNRHRHEPRLLSGPPSPPPLFLTTTRALRLIMMFISSSPLHIVWLVEFHVEHFCGCATHTPCVVHILAFACIIPMCSLLYSRHYLSIQTTAAPGGRNDRRPKPLPGRPHRRHQDLLPQDWDNTGNWYDTTRHIRAVQRLLLFPRCIPLVRGGRRNTMKNILECATWYLVTNTPWLPVLVAAGRAYSLACGLG